MTLAISLLFISYKIINNRLIEDKILIEMNNLEKSSFL